MIFLKKCICAMGMVLSLNACKPPEQEGRKAFGEQVESDLQKRIQSAIAEIETLVEGKDRVFWMKVICAYERLDLKKLEQLQNDKKSEIIQEQVLIIDFICATHIALDAQPNEVTLSNMANIRRSSFFRKITQ